MRAQEFVEESIVLDANSYVDVFVRGQHNNQNVIKLVARHFPNQNLHRLTQLLIDKYNVNPSAIVYGPSANSVPDINENFADGRKPGRKGLAKRVGVNCKQSVSKLRSIAKNSSGERQRMAHWCANMKSGRNK